MFSEEQVRQFRHCLQQFAETDSRDAYEHLGQILNMARDALRRIATQKGIPNKDADEVVAEAIMRAIDQDSLRTLWHNYADEADPEIYLRMKLRGKTSDYHREIEGRPAPLSLEEMWEQGRDIAVASVPPLRLDADARRRFWQTVRTCLNNELDFQILWLKLGEELQGSQIAETLCISHENARQRFHYAIERLQKCEEFRQVCQSLGLLNGGD
jgi:RNA polymerase sigma factor (sigma-70 family)